MTLLSRLARSPLVHFACLGALAFAFVRSNGARSLSSGKAPAEIVIDDAGLAGEALDDAIDEEILVREALAMGIDRDRRVVDARLQGLSDFLELDRDAGALAPGGAARNLDLQYRDPIIRRHLATLVRMMLSHLEPEAFPTEAELESYLHAHASNFVSPPRLRLTHVYLSRDRHGGSLAPDAARLLETLTARHVQPQDSASLGDPFAHGARRIVASLPEIERTLGARFADAAAAAELGTWSGPVESPYGLHLVWVEERTPGHTPALVEVKNRVLHDLLAERREMRLREGLANLRARYHVRLASQSDGSPSAP